MEAIKYYVKGAFVGVAETPEVLEQQEELIADMTAKVADLVADGRSEEEALGMAIASMGDLSGLVKEFATEEPAAAEALAAPAAPAVPEPVLVDVEIAKLRLHTVFMSAGGAVAVLFVLTMLGALSGSVNGGAVAMDLLITVIAVGWVAFEIFRFHQEPNEVATIDAAKRSMRTPILQWVAVCGVAFVMNLAFGTDGFWAWTVWIGAAAWPATVYVRRMLVDRGKFLHPKVEAEPAAVAVAAVGACV